MNASRTAAKPGSGQTETLHQRVGTSGLHSEADFVTAVRHVSGGPTTDNLSSLLYLPASPVGIPMDLSVVSEGMAMAGEASGYVGNIPRHYDQNLGPLLFTDYAADLARRVATLNPRRVLETAAGTGIVTRALRDALPAKAGLTATDLNAAMLDIAAKKFRPSETVEFRTADATALPFADASFDVIVCQFGVMFFPDKDKSYREAFRVLDTGGQYVFSIWDSHRHNPIGRIAHEVIGSFFPADPPQFQSVPFAYRFEPIKESLIDAGFASISATILKSQKEIADFSMLARGLVYGSPIIDQVQQRGGVDAERIVEAIVRNFRATFGDEPAVIPRQAIVFSANKPFAVVSGRSLKAGNS